MPSPLHSSAHHPPAGNWAPPADADNLADIDLPPKGNCWYCDKPVDQVRKFCSQSCRKDYQEENLFFPG